MATVKLSPVYNGYNDNNGVPNSGGKITVNFAGTTTPATVYTDASGTVANTNPVILDSRGAPVAPIWLVSGASYDLSMTTSADVPLTHVYNVAGINDFTVVSGNEWIDSGLTATYISATSFSVPSDATAFILPYTRLKIGYLTGYLYSSVVTAVYSAGFTTVTVVNDGASVLAAGIGSVYYGVLSPVNLSVPLTARKNKNQNLLLNPDMDVNLESVFSVTTSGEYCCDGWKMVTTGVSYVAQDQATLVPTPAQCGRHLTNSVKTYTTVSATNLTAGAYLVMRQDIEGYVVQEIYRQPFVVRFWAYARTTGDYSVSLQSPGQAYSCVMKYTILAADTWQYFELNVPASGSAGGWVFTTETGLSISFVVDAGSTFKSSAGNVGIWQSGNYLACPTQAQGASVNNIGLYIADVEIQKGTAETTWPCEVRPFALEVEMCKRHFQLLRASLRIYGSNGNLNGHTINFPVQLRSPPTITSSGATYVNCTSLAFSSIDTYSAFYGVTGSSTAYMSVVDALIKLNSRL